MAARRKDLGSALTAGLAAEQDRKFAIADRLLGPPGEVPAAGAGVPLAPPTPRTRIKRASFGLTEDDHRRLTDLRRRIQRAGADTNKSEIVRAGLESLAALGVDELLEVLERVEKLSPGRAPKQSS